MLCEVLVSTSSTSATPSHDVLSLTTQRGDCILFVQGNFVLLFDDDDVYLFYSYNYH